MVREEPEPAGGADLDEEGGALGLEPLAVQLMELMLTLAGSRRFCPLVTHSLDQLIYILIGEHSSYRQL